MAELLGLTSEAELSKLSRKDGKKASQSKKDWSNVKTTILVFTAQWADQCYYTYPLWVKFANRFSTSKVQFIECNASRFESLCHQFRISTSNMANQLPSLLLLEDNAEYLRFPPIDVTTGKAGRVVNYKERELVKYFELEARCLAT